MNDRILEAWERLTPEQQERWVRRFALRIWAFIGLLIVFAGVVGYMLYVGVKEML